jgi:hypothetical protein
MDFSYRRDKNVIPQVINFGHRRDKNVTPMSQTLVTGETKMCSPYHRLWSHERQKCVPYVMDFSYRRQKCVPHFMDFGHRRDKNVIPMSWTLVTGDKNNINIHIKTTITVH